MYGNLLCLPMSTLVSQCPENQREYNHYALRRESTESNGTNNLFDCPTFIT